MNQATKASVAARPTPSAPAPTVEAAWQLIRGDGRAEKHRLDQPLVSPTCRVSLACSSMIRLHVVDLGADKGPAHEP